MNGAPRVSVMERLLQPKNCPEIEYRGWNQGWARKIRVLRERARAELIHVHEFAASLLSQSALERYGTRAIKMNLGGVR